MLTTTEIRAMVHKVVSDLLAETQTDVPVLTGKEELHSLGLGSLMLARLVIELEATIGVDPFEQDVVISDVRSLDDLVTVYERGLAATTA